MGFITKTKVKLIIKMKSFSKFCYELCIAEWLEIFSLGHYLSRPKHPMLIFTTHLYNHNLTLFVSQNQVTTSTIYTIIVYLSHSINIRNQQPFNYMTIVFIKLLVMDYFVMFLYSYLVESLFSFWLHFSKNGVTERLITYLYWEL